jgi:DtxR family Mn-dependent transcriptional regulator
VQNKFNTPNEIAIMSERQSIVIEEYLLMLYHLRDAGEDLKSVTLAQRLKTKPPTVHATLQRMQRDGLVKFNKKREILFTAEGESYAKDIAFRHNLAEYFLCNTLDIPWYEVHKHAHLLEHAMTPTVVEKLAKFLKYPEKCPHGTPMPGFSLPAGNFTLDNTPENTLVEILMISEELEDSEEILQSLHQQNVIPGEKHKFVTKSNDLRIVNLEQDNNKITIPLHVASKIYVIDA